MLDETQHAPDFVLPGTEGNGFTEYQLSKHTERGAVVLVFYPFDFSPVCISELCEFRDAEWLTMSEDIDVFAISRDSCYAHRQFIEEYGFTFPLLSDVAGTVVEAYDVKYDVWEHHEGVSKRAVFLIDATETIRYAWKSEDAYESPDMRDVADELAALPTTDFE